MAFRLDYVLLGFLLNGFAVPFDGYTYSLSLSSGSLILERWTKHISYRADDLCFVEFFSIEDFLEHCERLDRLSLHAICSNVIKQNRASFKRSSAVIIKD